MSILLTRFRFHRSINKWNLKFRQNLETSSFQTSSSFGKLLLIRRSFETSSFKEEVLRFRFQGESWTTQTEPFCEPSLVSFPHSNQDTNTNDIGVKKDSQRTKANNNQQKSWWFDYQPNSFNITCISFITSISLVTTLSHRPLDPLVFPYFVCWRFCRCCCCFHIDNSHAFQIEIWVSKTAAIV